MEHVGVRKILLTTNYVHQLLCGDHSSGHNIATDGIKGKRVGLVRPLDTIKINNLRLFVR